MGSGTPFGDATTVPSVDESSVPVLQFSPSGSVIQRETLSQSILAERYAFCLRASPPSPRFTLKAALATALVVLGATLVVASYSATPIYDGNGNTGDETNSLALALTAVQTGVPSYGVKADGTPWTLGALTLPAYYAIYGIPLAAVEPIDRIDAARLVSRILAALALALALLACLAGGGLSLRRDRFSLATIVLAGGGLAFLFGTSHAFVFVSAFARVDVLGLLAVCLACAGYAWFRRAPGFASLFAYGLSVGFAYFANNFAFVIVGLIFALTIGAHIRRRSLVLPCAIGLAAAGAVTAVAYVLLNHVWLTETVSQSTVYPDAPAMLVSAVRLILTSSPEVVVAFGWDYYPDLVAAVAATVVAAGLCLSFALADRLAGRTARFSALELALTGIAVPLAVGWCMLALNGQYHRFSYLPMILIAVTLPFLTAVCAIRDRVVAPLATLLVVSAFVLFAPSIVTGHSEFGDRGFAGVATPRWRSNPSEYETAVKIGNAVRQEHLRSLVGHLDRANISQVLADDPLFALLNEAEPRFLFVNEVIATPEAEWEALGQLRRRFGVTYIVANPFGASSALHGYGYPLLKTALASQPQRATVAYPGGRVVARRVFTSSSPTGLATETEYIYGGEPSTPFTVYSLKFQARP